MGVLRWLKRLWRRWFAPRPETPALEPAPNPAATYTITGILEASLIESEQTPVGQSDEIDMNDPNVQAALRSINQHVAQVFSNVGVTMAQANRTMAQAQRQILRAQRQVPWHGNQGNFHATWTSTYITTPKRKDEDK